MAWEIWTGNPMYLVGTRLNHSANVAWEIQTLTLKPHVLSRHTPTLPERFELSQGNPMYLAGTRLNHSAKATQVFCNRGLSYTKIWNSNVLYALKEYLIRREIRTLAGNLMYLAGIRLNHSAKATQVFCNKGLSYTKIWNSNVLYALKEYLM